MCFCVLDAPYGHVVSCLYSGYVASVCVKLFATMINPAGSPFQLAMPSSRVYPLESSVLRIPLGRPAVVGIDRGRGALQSITPDCEITCKSATLLLGAVLREPWAPPFQKSGPPWSPNPVSNGNKLHYNTFMRLRDALFQ